MNMSDDEKSDEVSDVPVDTNGTEEKSDKQKSGKEKEDENSEPLNEGEYEVNQIRDVTAVNGELRYLVAWKGYGSDEDTWEPEEYLETARLFVNEYNASHPDKVKKARQLVQAQRKKQKKEGKMKKRKLSNHGSDSSEQSEVANISSSLRSSKRLKVLCRDEDESDDKTDRDEDYVLSSERRRSARNLRQKRKRVTAKPQIEKTEKEKQASTDSWKLTPKRMKNAWLYEDPDSDTTSGRSEKSPMVENAVTEKGKQSSVTVREHASSDSDRKNSFDKKKQDKVVKGIMQKAPIPNFGLPEPKVEFTGIVQCRDGTIKALYNNKNETRTRVVSIKEAYEIDSSGLVQYFINRCEFAEPQSSEK